MGNPPRFTPPPLKKNKGFLRFICETKHQQLSTPPPHPSDVLERPYTAGGQGVPPPRPPPPPPLPMFEADSQNFASAPSVPRGFKLKDIWPTFGRDHRGTLGGGGSQLTPSPPPPSTTPTPRPPLVLQMAVMSPHSVSYAAAACLRPATAVSSGVCSDLRSSLGLPPKHCASRPPSPAVPLASADIVLRCVTRPSKSQSSERSRRKSAKSWPTTRVPLNAPRSG